MDCSYLDGSMLLILGGFTCLIAHMQLLNLMISYSWNRVFTHCSILAFILLQSKPSYHSSQQIFGLCALSRPLLLHSALYPISAIIALLWTLFLYFDWHHLIMALIASFRLLSYYLLAIVADNPSWWILWFRCLYSIIRFSFLLSLCMQELGILIATLYYGTRSYQLIWLGLDNLVTC